MRWRLRLLVGAALLGCGGLFLLARWLAEPRQLVADWHVGASGRVELGASQSDGLGAHSGKALTALSAAGRRLELPDAMALQHSARWMIEDETRERYRHLQAQLSELLDAPSPTLHFSDGSQVQVPLRPAGWSGLGGVFWLTSAMALVLYMSALVMVLSDPSRHNLLYALMALCQAGNLVFIAAASTPRLGLAPPIVNWDMTARMAFDLVTATAAVQLCSFYAPRVRGARAVAAAAWIFAGTLIVLQVLDRLTQTWWWTQLGVLALCLIGVAILSASYRVQPHPLVMQMRRFGLVVVATWILLTLAIAATVRVAGAANQLTGIASMLWVVFLASLLLLVPFFARSRQILREFSLLAAVSTVTTSLDLLFIALFSFSHFASLALSLFLGLAVYAGARQWMISQLLDRNRLTTERMFEQLYRRASEVEANPERAPELLLTLVREYFEPLQADLGTARLGAARVEDRGATLVVPVPTLAVEPDATVAKTSIRLRHAGRGRRRFSIADARLSDRIVEQLQRAVAFNHAVEQGRNEERNRIAQDLHDDIGARLLTLMYRAQSPEIEEYLRHTLKDLKTLTRGLAKSTHRLSHAAAEWKADLTQRLTAADIAIGWSFNAERDVSLSVVEWSALTRILRELTSNTIAHADARRVDIALRIEGDALELEVADDGRGRDPSHWSHGLGLGGVRKRVRQLGGEVHWHEVAPKGIRCRVRLPGLFAAR